MGRIFLATPVLGESLSSTENLFSLTSLTIRSIGEKQSVVKLSGVLKLCEEIASFNQSQRHQLSSKGSAIKGQAKGKIASVTIGLQTDEDLQRPMPCITSSWMLGWKSLFI